MDWEEYFNMRAELIGGNWYEVLYKELQEHEASLPMWKSHVDYESKLELIEALKNKLGV